MGTFQVEMRWRCSACRHENRGRDKGCGSCGKRKSGEAFYDAPGTESPSLADAVTDPDLVRQAEAGPDWECRFCRAHERRDSGECASCGSAQGDSASHETRWSDGTSSRGGARPSGPAPPVTSPPRSRWRSVSDHLGSMDPRALRRWGLAAVLAAAAVLALWALLRTRVVDATVAAASWKCDVAVERYSVIRQEGFDEDRPGDAFDTSSEGTRHHHYDHVPDGTSTESYVVQEACGQSCTTTPVTCVANGNGFKTCSGGGTTCSTRYCSSTRTRQVQKYRDVSVRKTWYSWKAWRWRHHRTVSEAGPHSRPFACPDGEKVGLGASTGAGEKERASETRSFTVTFREPDGDDHEWSPSGLEEFRSFPPGRRVKVRVGVASGTEVVRE